MVLHKATFPAVLFEAGVTTLGGTWITDGSAFKQALRHGAPWSAFARKLAMRAAEQTADFGAPQASIAVRVYQLSAIAGRGIAARATL